MEKWKGTISLKIGSLILFFMTMWALWNGLYEGAKVLGLLFIGVTILEK